MKVFEGGRVPIKAWVDGVEFEDEARKQVENLAKMPFVFKHVAVMPDVHAGIGATVGSVIATQGAIIPAAVGVDIGCGMIAQRTSLTASDLPDDLSGLRSAIEAAVPHGRTNNGQRDDKGAWQDEPPLTVRAAWEGLSEDLRPIIDKYPRLEKSRALSQLGTLGTGNHFIEICLDEEQRVWVMLHSGSRGVGNAIGSTFIALAKEDMKRWFINVPDQDLAYLPQGSEHFNDYMRAVSWAQRYAHLNRRLMLFSVMDALEGAVGGPDVFSGEEAVNCHHNYVATERHFGQNVMVTRKGAVSAKEGELGIIPGSMGAKSFIVRGKGNRESFMSCSHGAGRRMSRTKAKRTFTVEDHIAATAGVECRKDSEVLDETPMAYKSIDAVINAEADLIDVVHTLKQVVCVKG
ncbi:MAG: RtcB family protein [Patescibacteria group bacterium]|nr:RtcB family protein [Patescibacteria group bacterium]